MIFHERKRDRVVATGAVSVPTVKLELSVIEKA